jgi:hypothetical protein
LTALYIYLVVFGAQAAAVAVAGFVWLIRISFTVPSTGLVLAPSEPIHRQLSGWEPAAAQPQGAALPELANTVAVTDSLRRAA